jgi:hypothetical protein
MCALAGGSGRLRVKGSITTLSASATLSRSSPQSRDPEESSREPLV